MTTTIGGRLTHIRGSRSQAEFAQELGVHKNSLGNYERDSRTPDADFLRKIVEAGYNANWLITGEGPVMVGQPEVQPTEKDGLGDDFALVPYYDVEASAGNGRTVGGEAAIGNLAFRREWLRQKGLRNKDLSVIRVAGDSMYPTIRDGSWVLIDTNQAHVKSDGIYALLVDGDLVAKRLQVDLAGGGMYIRSDNPAYREQHLTADQANRLHIVGRVIWAGVEF